MLSTQLEFTPAPPHASPRHASAPNLPRPTHVFVGKDKAAGWASDSARLRRSVVGQEDPLVANVRGGGLGHRHTAPRGADVNRQTRRLQLDIRGQTLDRAFFQVGQDLVGPTEPLFVGAKRFSVRHVSGDVGVVLRSARGEHSARGLKKCKTTKRPGARNPRLVRVGSHVSPPVERDKELEKSAEPPSPTILKSLPKRPSVVEISTSRCPMTGTASRETVSCDLR